jgi:hypothetical protein
VVVDRYPYKIAFQFFKWNITFGCEKNVRIYAQHPRSHVSLNMHLMNSAMIDHAPCFFPRQLLSAARVYVHMCQFDHLVDPSRKFQSQPK